MPRGGSAEAHAEQSLLLALHRLVAEECQHGQKGHLLFKVFQLLDTAHAALGAEQSDLSMAIACWHFVMKIDRATERFCLRGVITYANKAAVAAGLLPTSEAAVGAMEARILKCASAAVQAPTAGDWLRAFLERLDIITEGRLPSAMPSFSAAAARLLAWLVLQWPISKDMPPRQFAAFVAGLVAVRLGIAKADEMFDAEVSKRVNDLLGLLPQCPPLRAAEGSFQAATGMTRPASKIALKLAEVAPRQ